MKKIGIMLACLLAGCVTENKMPENIIAENGTYLKNISAISITRASDGFKIVDINGETYEDTDLFYRVVWFDADGAQIKTGASDKAVQASIRRDIPFNWRVVSPDNTAQTYKVYISNRPVRQ